MQLFELFWASVWFKLRSDRSLIPYNIASNLARFLQQDEIQPQKLSSSTAMPVGLKTGLIEYMLLDRQSQQTLLVASYEPR